MTQPTTQADYNTETNEHLGKAAAGGVAWGYASFFLSKGLVFLSTVVLARLLTPADFGVVGYAVVLISYLDVARDLGVGPALIARKHVDRRIISSAFWVALGSGALLALVMFLGAPLVSSFYEDARAEPVTRVLSLAILFSALGSVPDALLYRGLAFNRRIIPDVVKGLTRGVVSVVCAMLGMGYWSLVAGQLAGVAGFCLVAWVMQPFRPTFEFDLDESKQLLGFGLAVSGTLLLTTFLSSYGLLIVGRELGAAALGIFTIANNITTVVLVSSYSIISTVLFPVYARLQGDTPGLQRGYSLAQRYMTLFAFPVGMGMILTAPVFVHAVYGSHWADAVPVIQIMVINSMLIAIGWQAGDIAKATGHAKLQLVLVAVPTAMLIPAITLSAQWFGLLGVAWVYVVGAIFGMTANTIMMWRLVKLPLSKAIGALVPGTLAALTVLVTVGGFLLLSDSEWPDYVRLAVATVLGTLSLLLVVSQTDRGLLNIGLGRIRQSALSNEAPVQG